MRLALTTPPAWRIRKIGDTHVAVLDDVLLVWGGLVPLPHDRAAWMTHALSVEIDAMSALRQGDLVARTTATGWPMYVASAEVVRSDATVAEHRLGAFYAFLEYGAVALVRARSRAGLDAIRDQIDTVLATAVPAWQAGTPSCLHDLFAG